MLKLTFFTFTVVHCVICERIIRSFGASIFVKITNSPVFIMYEKSSAFLCFVATLETLFDRVRTVTKFFDPQFVILFASPFESGLAADIWLLNEMVLIL